MGSSKGGPFFIGGFMFRGRAITYVIIDECLHEVVDHSEALRRIAESMAERQTGYVTEIDKLPKFAMEVNKRPPEPNDWRRKGKRGFNGYHRYG